MLLGMLMLKLNVLGHCFKKLCRRKTSGRGKLFKIDCKQLSKLRSHDTTGENRAEKSQIESNIDRWYFAIVACSLAI